MTCRVIKMLSWHCILLMLLPMLLPTMSSLSNPISEALTLLGSLEFVELLDSRVL
jgi:hypothetical protein